MADDFKALTFLKLRVPGGGDEGVLKSPGDSVTRAELEDAGQDQDDIDRLFADGALGYPDDPIHPDHAPPEISVPETSDHAVSSDETGGGGDA